MVTSLGTLFAGVAVINLVFAQSSSDREALVWLNSLFLSPSVETQYDLTTSTEVNLNPEEVTQTTCVTEKGQEGVCVLHYQCRPDSRSLIKDGTTLLDVRIRPREGCPNVLEVCCMNQVLTTKDNSVYVDISGNEENVLNRGVSHNNMLWICVATLQFYGGILMR